MFKINTETILALDIEILEIWGKITEKKNCLKELNVPATGRQGKRSGEGTIFQCNLFILAEFYFPYMQYCLIKIN